MNSPINILKVKVYFYEHKLIKSWFKKLNRLNKGKNYKSIVKKKFPLNDFGKGQRDLINSKAHLWGQ